MTIFYGTDCFCVRDDPYCALHFFALRMKSFPFPFFRFLLLFFPFFVPLPLFPPPLSTSLTLFLAFLSFHIFLPYFCIYPSSRRYFPPSHSFTSRSFFPIFHECRFEGEDALSFLASKSKVTEDDVTSIIKQVLDALEYLHRKNILHLDIRVRTSQ